MGSLGRIQFGRVNLGVFLMSRFAPLLLASEWTHFFVTKGGSQLTFRTQLERMCSFFVINGGLNDLLDGSSVIGPLGAPSVLIIMCRVQELKSVSLPLEIHIAFTQALQIKYYPDQSL